MENREKQILMIILNNRLKNDPIISEDLYQKMDLSIRKKLPEIRKAG